MTLVFFLCTFAQGLCHLTNLTSSWTPAYIDRILLGPWHTICMMHLDSNSLSDDSLRFPDFLQLSQFAPLFPYYMLGTYPHVIRACLLTTLFSSTPARPQSDFSLFFRCFSQTREKTFCQLMMI
jgi:hypothetical protein